MATTQRRTEEGVSSKFRKDFLSRRIQQAYAERRAPRFLSVLCSCSAICGRHRRSRERAGGEGTAHGGRAEQKRVPLPGRVAASPTRPRDEPGSAKRPSLRAGTGPWMWAAGSPLPGLFWASYPDRGPTAPRAERGRRFHSASPRAWSGRRVRRASHHRLPAGQSRSTGREKVRWVLLHLRCGNLGREFTSRLNNKAESSAGIVEEENEQSKLRRTMWRVGTCVIL